MTETGTYRSFPEIDRLFSGIRHSFPGISRPFPGTNSLVNKLLILNIKQYA